MKATAHDGRGVGSVARGRQVFGSKAGQALTEFTLVLPVLALIFIGVLDLGRAFHTEVAASNAARVGLLFAQQVASPRMLDCEPGMTCHFITVGDIMATTRNEAQGGIDASQMQVGVCLQHVPTCPIADPSIAVGSDEPITVSVTVPFTTITPFVHLTSIGGSVSGHTFAFEPVVPTDTPGPTITPAPSSTPAPTSTLGPTATPQPAPLTSMPIITYTSAITSATITWQVVNGNGAINEVYARPTGNNNGAWIYHYPALGGTSASVTLSTSSASLLGTCVGSCFYSNLSQGTYDFYVHTHTSGGDSYQPPAGANCRSNNGANGCLTFTLNQQ